MTSQRLSLAFLFTVCLVGLARADLPPPESLACWTSSGSVQPLALGSPCTFNGPGTCKNTTCTGIDKAKWDHDSGADPPTYTYACVACVPNGGGKDSGSDQTKDSSGCAIGGRLARTVGPWLAAGLFAAAMMLARRRPRR
jgi:hypothetical protein